MTRRRGAIVALTAAVIAAAAAWYGDLASAIPIDVYREQSDEPMLQPVHAAVREVEARLAWSGGLPHDAVLRRVVTQQRTAISPGGGTSPAVVMAYSLDYAPRDAIAFRDIISADVSADTVERCLESGTLPSRHYPRQLTPWACKHYALSFPLRVYAVHREWRPWPVRAVAAWWQRSFGPQVAAPATVHATCGDHVDVGAIRRIIAAVQYPIVLKGASPWGRPWDRRHPWESARAVIGDRPAATVTWSSPYPTAPSWPPGRPRVPVREAIVVDGMLQDVLERAVIVRFAHPDHKISVRALRTADDEPVCPPLREQPAVAYAPPVPDWDAMLAFAVERAQDEARWRTSFRPPATTSRVTGTERHPGGSSAIDVETHQGPERWHARFTIDEREPALREAEFTRL